MHHHLWEVAPFKVKVLGELRHLQQLLLLENIFAPSILNPCVAPVGQSFKAIALTLFYLLSLIVAPPTH